MTHRISIAKLRPEYVQTVENLVQKIAEHARLQSGTVEYTVYRNCEDRDMMLFYQVYEDKPSEDQHMSSPLVRELHAMIPTAVDKMIVRGSWDVVVAKK